jgi:hypothetical protein
MHAWNFILSGWRAVTGLFSKFIIRRSGGCPCLSDGVPDMKGLGDFGYRRYRVYNLTQKVLFTLNL